MLPVRRLADEHVHGEGARLLLAVSALHADVSPDAPPSGLLGWLLTSLGHDVGFPAPVGGAGELTGALGPLAIAREHEHVGGPRTGRRGVPG
jgi:phytoene dehydrogenase-like protein